MHSMQFGARMVESLVSGGADMTILLEFEQALEALFVAGPHCGRLSLHLFSDKIDEMYELFAAALRSERG